METKSKAKFIFYKTISIVVIVLNLALITFIWAVQGRVSSSAMTILTEVDNIAQVVRNGIDIVEPEVGNLRQIIGQVEAASEEISQNVSEEGIILRLLPEAFVDSLTASSQSLRENFLAVYDLLGATADILLAVDRIPFVDIPEKGLATVATLQETMEEIADQVETLKNNIVEVRSETAARISRVTDAATFLGTETEQFHQNLIQIDTDLESLQISVRRYQRLTRPVVIISVLIMSLLSGWVVYSQVTMITRLERHNPQEANLTAEPQELRPDDKNLDEDQLA